MITKLETLELLKTCETLNLGSFKAGQSDVFWEVLNAAMPEIGFDQARRALLKLSSERTTDKRGQFITPGDWLQAIRTLTEGDLDAARQRLRTEIQHHGPFVPVGIEDPREDVRWRQAAVTAYMRGASREDAEAEAYRVVGRPTPELAPTKQDDLRGIVPGYGV